MGCSISVRRPNIKKQKLVKSETNQSSPARVSGQSGTHRHHSLAMCISAEEEDDLNTKTGPLLKLKDLCSKHQASSVINLNLLNITSEMIENKEMVVLPQEFLRQFSNGSSLLNLTSAISLRADDFFVPELSPSQSDPLLLISGKQETFKRSQTSNIFEVIDLLKDVPLHANDQNSQLESSNFKDQQYFLEERDFPVYQMFDELFPSPCHS